MHIFKDIEELFGKEGCLAEQIDGYEVRQGQINMAKDIRNFTENQAKNIFMGEGEVGIGKSMAYLLTLLFSDVSKPIIISTSSITLQDQLVTKDLVDVKEIYDKHMFDDFNFIAFKGRNNYVCKRKYEQKKFEALPAYLQGDFDGIRSLMTSDSYEGEKPDKIDNRLWKEISARTYECPGRACNMYSDCFYQKKKKQVNSGDYQVIVINHSLLTADYMLSPSGEKGILPDSEYLVIDEAHKLEDYVVLFYTKVLSERVFTNLEQDIKKALENNDFSEMEISVATAIKKSIRNVYEAYRSLPIKDLTDQIAKLAEDNEDELITEPVDLVGDFDWEEKLHSLAHKIKEFEFEDTVILSNRLEDLGDRLHWLSSISPELAVFGEVSGNSSRLKLAKINVDEILESLWLQTVKKGKKEVDRKFILTSATLTVDNKPSYLADRLGMNLNKITSGIYQSSFDYSKQAKLIIPKGYNPKSNDFDQKVADGLVSLIDRGYDKSLILFTSYRQMEYIQDIIWREFEGEYLILEQTDDYSKKYLLNKFQSADKAILMAQAASFGTGVDIKGDKNLVLTKLNFDRPNEPIFKAKSNLVKSKGGNPFMDLSIPRVSMRTKQQVGRSIRSNSDNANVVIFDERLLNSRWGGMIKNSLPVGDYGKSAFTYL